MGIVFTHSAKHFEELLLLKALSTEVQNSLPDRILSKLRSHCIFKVLFFVLLREEHNLTLIYVKTGNCLCEDLNNGKRHFRA